MDFLCKDIKAVKDNGVLSIGVTFQGRLITKGRN